MPDIVVVTATFYKERADLDVRLPLALASVRAARARGLAIVVVDGSPDPGVRTALKIAGAEVLQQDEDGPGFGNAVRQAVTAGAEMIDQDGSVHWQEPEKHDLIRFHRKLGTIAKQRNAAILVPRRALSTWDTYPKEQKHQEIFTNMLVKIASGDRLDFDFTFGPKVFRGEALGLVAECDSPHWGAHMIPVVWAVKRGLAVTSAIVNYRHPKAQRRAEEGVAVWARKRRTQLVAVSEALEQAWGKDEA